MNDSNTSETVSVTPDDTTTEPAASPRRRLRGPSLTTMIIVGAVAVISGAIGIGVGPPVHNWLSADSSSQQAGDEASDGNVTWYISQMHPWIIQPKPGQCPICGMDLTPVDPDRFAGEIAIDPVIVQNMGVRIRPATVGAVSRNVRTVGTVQLDEERIVDVVQRFDGWIEDVHVGAQWDQVQAGDPLFTIYSPAVFTAEEEYLIALSTASTLADTSARDLIAAAQQKLSLLGIPEAEISRLQKEQKASATITVTSPASGIVWHKEVHRGSKIAANTVAYRLVDLSQVWVEATVYEDQLPFISQGQPVRLVLDNSGSLPIEGRIDAIYPAIDTRTRGNRVRIVVSNTGKHPTLKPGMFATVTATVVLADDAVRIPFDAIIGTGERRVAFVSLGRGKFEPRDVVVTAVGSDGLAAIGSGIQPGEQVVISGQFLLDSESKMRSALVKVMQGDLASTQKKAPVLSDEQQELPASLMPAWYELMTAYLKLQELLYQEESPLLTAAVATLHTATKTFIETAQAHDEHFHHRHPAVEQLGREVASLGGSDLEELRPDFGSLSITLNTLLKRFGQPEGLPTTLVGMRCGMAEGIPELGVWLQFDGDVRNPYFGAANDMRDCAADVWGLPQAIGATDAVSKKGVEEKIEQSQPKVKKETDAHSSHAMPFMQPLDAATVAAVETLYAAFYRNDLEGAQAAAQTLAERFKTLGNGWENYLHQAHAISAASELKVARQAAGEIGVSLHQYLGKHGGDIGATLENVMIYRCGMARGIADKGVWLQFDPDQQGAEPRNPYFGEDHGMNACAVGAWSLQASGLVETE